MPQSVVRQIAFKQLRFSMLDQQISLQKGPLIFITEPNYRSLSKLQSKYRELLIFTLDGSSTLESCSLSQMHNLDILPARLDTGFQLQKTAGVCRYDNIGATLF